MSNPIRNTKTNNLGELLELRNQWRTEDLTVVFTNGVFDIIHPGHVEYLREAAKLGDKLVIGLNSDVSVKMLDKGTNRPIQSEDARATILSAFEMVDEIVLFGDPTPLALIRALKPDVLVKGGDYTIDQIVGAQDVIDNGGQVRQLQFVQGFSTSAIEQKIRSSRS